VAMAGARQDRRCFYPGFAQGFVVTSEEAVFSYKLHGVLTASARGEHRLGRSEPRDRMAGLVPDPGEERSRGPAPPCDPGRAAPPWKGSEMGSPSLGRGAPPDQFLPGLGIRSDSKTSNSSPASVPATPQRNGEEA
jgi:hypothetical protein